MAAPQISKFPTFGSLPEQIRKDIWQRAVKKVLNGPSIQFLNLTRDHVDSVEEDRLSHEAVVRAVADAAADWDQLTPNEQMFIQEEAGEAAIRRYRASLVKLAPTQDRTGLAQYSARWQLNEVAVTCTEALDNARQVLEEVQMNGSVPVAGENGPNAVAPFHPSKNIVCLVGPENDAVAGMPFFANEAMVNPDYQVVFVATPEFRQNPFGNHALEDRNSTSRCVSLLECCPELRDVEKLAFIYREETDGVLYRFPFRLGLEALWPNNLPGLKEVYLIDPSISLRDGIQAPPQWTPRFEGCGATFYDVTEADQRVWQFPPIAEGYRAASVLVDAAEMEAEYANHVEDEDDASPIVRVLACVPHTRGQ